MKSTCRRPESDADGAGRTGAFASWRRLALAFLFFSSPMLGADNRERSLKAAQVFDYSQPILFQDDFQSGKFGRWRFSEDANYGIVAPHRERIAIVDAPELPGGKKAVKFTVPRAPNSFRAEVSLPHEDASTVRWYAARIYIPKDWVCDGDPGDDIVMQWHGVPGNWRATFPNLAISISGEKWVVKQNYGAAQTGPTRTADEIDGRVLAGAWVSFVVHVKWSGAGDGFLRIWKDGRLVVDRKGPNVYTTIGVVYSPYFKTGIYHPTWNLKSEERRNAFLRSQAASHPRVIYVTDVKVGGDRARFEDVAPPALSAAAARLK